MFRDQKILQLDMIKQKTADALFAIFPAKIENGNKFLIDLDGGEFGDCVYSSCINPHSFVVATHDKEFRKALIESDYILVDGIGYVIYHLLRYGVLIHRQTGNFTIETVLRKCASNARVALLGGTGGSVEHVAKKIIDKFGAEVVFKYEPPMLHKIEQEFVDTIANSIIEAEANIILIGIGAPKQEILSNYLKKKLGSKKVYIQGVGAYFDYLSGRVPMPPRIISIFGMEWLYRLIFSFRRVWKRTFVSAPIFVLLGMINILRTRNVK